MALIFGLHSLTVDYRTVAAMSGFPEMHRRYDFVGVSPSGRADGVPPYWNAAPVADNEDIEFLARLLDHLEATLCIDTGAVFSVGMSNGAQMSSLLACHLSERISAIAAIAGVEFNDPCGGAPVPVIAFHGRADPIVPYSGGGLNSVAIADANWYHGAVPPGTAQPTGVEASMRRWARHNGCDPEAIDHRVTEAVTERVWRHCQAATELYVLDGVGHAWPGKPQPAFESTFGPGSTDVEAATLIWDFFFAHRG